VAELLYLVCPVCGILLLFPVLVYFIPVGMLFGRPHFYEDTHEPTDVMAGAYVLGFYLCISVLITLIRICVLRIKDHS